MAAERTFGVSQLSAHLGLKVGMARRYYLAYEAATGEKLPRDPANKGRLVNDEQLAVLKQARELIQANSMLSVKEAIKRLLGIDTIPTAQASPQREVLEAIALELRALREEKEGLRAENTALREENAELKERLRALPLLTLASDEVLPPG